MPTSKSTLLAIVRSISTTPRTLSHRPNFFTTTPTWTHPSAIRIARYHQTPFLRSINTPFLPTQKSSESKPEADSSPSTRSKDQEPGYELTFTCKPCSTRSTHRVSKQAYHHGSVLITCPECKNRHLIADHLNIFGDKSQTIEDIMREKGELIKKGTLSENGDLEFWDDGSKTDRKK